MSRERNHISDIRHSRQVHHTSFKTKPKTCMTHRTISSKIQIEIGHVTYTEAIEILEKHNDEFEYKVFWGCDLQTEHERFLTEQACRLSDPQMQFPALSSKIPPHASLYWNFPHGKSVRKYIRF